MIRVLVVEDSAVARELLNHILSSDPEIEVIGNCTDGLQAVEFIARDRPDVVTMDVMMPKMDGYEATRKIMETTPVPIVIVSASVLPEEVDKTWRAVEAGAVAQIMKPGFFDMGNPGDSTNKLLQTVKIMSQVKVVRRWSRPNRDQKAVSEPLKKPVSVSPRDIEVVAIGASTGGPPVLQKIFSGLPNGFGASVLLVQHIAPGFASGFVDWLNRTSSLKLHLAVHGEVALPGNVYVAPDGHHMGIERSRKIVLSTHEPENGLRPAVSYLFRTVAESFGSKAVGVLLTGMGRDGAGELKLMRDAGAVTVAQDQETCIVFGMPGEAVKLGAAQHVLPPDRITEMLRKLVKEEGRGTVGS
jgi:two-component system, chemotaxis family, protein-glutamate methylesterase/glutaminase